MISHAHHRVLWSSAADLEVAEAASWYADRHIRLANRFLNAVRDAAIAAAISPELYARVHGDLRRVLAHRFPYALIFRDTDNEVLVVACYHLHRDPQVWQSRG